jgi:hypothetical protein
MKIPEQFNESRRNQKFRETQPMHMAYKLIDLDDPQWKKQFEAVIIDVRVFWPNRSEVCRAVIWIKDKNGNRYGWGVGKTKGFGYHHESAAIQDAFDDMGIKFDRSFDGAGSGAQEKAIRDVGEALGYKNTVLVDFNP